MFKLKIILAAAVLALGVSGVAFASTGHVPGPLKDVVGGSTVSGDPDDQSIDATGDDAAEDQYSDDAAGDQYSDHDDVSDVARDKDETGTMTLPNGHEVENHGLAVREAAQAQHEDVENEAPSGTPGQQGEEQHSNQAETHENNGNNGMSSSASTVTSPRGGQHGRQ